MRRSQLPEPINAHTEDLPTSCLYTANGQRLSPKQDRFISLYIKYSDAQQAAKEAGYSVRAEIKDKEAQWKKIGKKLLCEDYIQNEIAYRMQELRSKDIADTEEIMKYLTSVMRGEEKDQFGMDVSIQDRTNAAKELMRRMHEIETAARTEGSKEIHLILEKNY